MLYRSSIIQLLNKPAVNLLSIYLPPEGSTVTQSTVTQSNVTQSTVIQFAVVQLTVPQFDVSSTI